MACARRRVVPHPRLHRTFSSAPPSSREIEEALSRYPKGAKMLVNYSASREGYTLLYAEIEEELVVMLVEVNAETARSLKWDCVVESLQETGGLVRLPGGSFRIQ